LRLVLSSDPSEIKIVQSNTPGDFLRSIFLLKLFNNLSVYLRYSGIVKYIYPIYFRVHEYEENKRH